LLDEALNPSPTFQTEISQIWGGEDDWGEKRYRMVS
jgi:hypothetical protein